MNFRFDDEARPTTPVRSHGVMPFSPAGAGAAPPRRGPARCATPRARTGFPSGFPPRRPGSRGRPRGIASSSTSARCTSRPAVNFPPSRWRMKPGANSTRMRRTPSSSCTRSRATPTCSGTPRRGT